MLEWRKLLCDSTHSTHNNPGKKAFHCFNNSPCSVCIFVYELAIIFIVTSLRKLNKCVTCAVEVKEFTWEDNAMNDEKSYEQCCCCWQRTCGAGWKIHSENSSHGSAWILSACAEQIKWPNESKYFNWICEMTKRMFTYQLSYALFSNKEPDLLIK